MPLPGNHPRIKSYQQHTNLPPDTICCAKSKACMPCNVTNAPCHTVKPAARWQPVSFLEGMLSTSSVSAAGRIIAVSAAWCHMVCWLQAEQSEPVPRQRRRKAAPERVPPMMSPIKSHMAGAPLQASSTSPLFLAVASCPTQPPPSFCQVSQNQWSLP